jgi:hypothetical protein
MENAGIVNSETTGWTLSLHSFMCVACLCKREKGSVSERDYNVWVCYRGQYFDLTYSIVTTLSQCTFLFFSRGPAQRVI